MNTIHSDDVAGVIWACAEWMAPLGRAEADKVAGEEIQFHNDKNKVSEVAGMPPPNQKVVVPLFNAVSASSIRCTQCTQLYTLFHRSTTIRRHCTRPGRL